MNKILKWVLIILGIIVVIGASAFAYMAYIENQYSDSPYGIVEKKPAIYLYPEQDSFINVKLDINGEIITDIPEYGEGWNVFATTNSLIDNNYDYLFYEAQLNKLELPDKGWIVPYSELYSWFDQNLIKLGLNDKEKSQFKEYWLSELPESSYYEIRLLNNEFLKQNMDLIVSPQPDTMIRVNFYFVPLNEQISLSEPEIITPERKGFTVVEWGGILAN